MWEYIHYVLDLDEDSKIKVQMQKKKPVSRFGRNLGEVIKEAGFRVT
jgi:hypothetical protein